MPRLNIAPADCVVCRLAMAFACLALFTQAKRPSSLFLHPKNIDPEVSQDSGFIRNQTRTAFYDRSTNTILFPA